MNLEPAKILECDVEWCGSFWVGDIWAIRG